MKYGFIIDNRKCIGCHACTVACKSEHDVPIGVNRTWVKYIEKGQFPNTRRLFSVMRCNHCEDAPCVEICPVTALYLRDDGIVDFDNRRCIGCKGCMQACPYDALFIDPNTSTAAKCNYCAHRVDIGLEPACVNVCPEHAIISGDMDDPLSEITQLLAREQVAVRKVEKGTRPKLFYIDGDQASLNPTSTEQSSSYMWNSQSTGVGHFAKYAEERIFQSDPRKMVEQLAGSSTNKILSKAEEVVQEAQRVYDAPNKGAVWGWEVSAYVWTKAIATGAFLIPFLFWVLGFTPLPDPVQWVGLALGLVFLTITGGLLIIDLDRPARFAYILLRPQWRSWLVRGGYAITIYGALLTVCAAAKFFHWTNVLIPAVWGCAIFAVLTAVYTAFLFAQAKGRDFWQSPTLSLHMLVHAVMAGTAVFALLGLFIASSAAWFGFLKIVFTCGIAFNLLIITIEMLTAHPTVDSKRVVQMILSEQFSTLFWFGTLVVGNLLPALLIWLGGSTLFAAAGVLVLVGIYITEYIWVRAPQLIPLS